jgi:hypothetical protein
VLGLGRRREDVRPPRDARALEDIVLRDWRAREVRLGELWSTNPALLVFLRHYG